MIINFKALTFALAMFMLLLCEKSQSNVITHSAVILGGSDYPELTREDLINSQWRYFKGVS